MIGCVPCALLSFPPSLSAPPASPLSSCIALFPAPIVCLSIREGSAEKQGYACVLLLSLLPLFLPLSPLIALSSAPCPLSFSHFACFSLFHAPRSSRTVQGWGGVHRMLRLKRLNLGKGLAPCCLLARLLRCPGTSSTLVSTLIADITRVAHAQSTLVTAIVCDCFPSPRLLHLLSPFGLPLPRSPTFPNLLRLPRRSPDTRSLALRCALLSLVLRCALLRTRLFAAHCRP